MQVSILGTPYTIKIKDYKDDKAFEERSIIGYCDDLQKELVVCDPRTYNDAWKDEPQSSVDRQRKETLRHEIVHAFLFESGLSDSACVVQSAWAKNEEMVDWFAVQGPKIYRAWQEADAL